MRARRSRRRELVDERGKLRAFRAPPSVAVNSFQGNVAREYGVRLAAPGRPRARVALRTAVASPHPKPWKFLRFAETRMILFRMPPTASPPNVALRSSSRSRYLRSKRNCAVGAHVPHRKPMKAQAVATSLASMIAILSGCSATSVDESDVEEMGDVSSAASTKRSCSDQLVDARPSWSLQQVRTTCQGRNGDCIGRLAAARPGYSSTELRSACDAQPDGCVGQLAAARPGYSRTELRNTCVSRNGDCIGPLAAARPGLSSTELRRACE